MTSSQLNEEALKALKELDTCTVADAIETFDLRARNTGFTNSGVRCMFPDRPTMVGFAATARLRSGDRPMSGSSYHDRTDWWQSILRVPGPRVAVLEDIDDPAGVGAFLGDVHAAMLHALGCVGCVTNGGVRKMRLLAEGEMQVFAGNIAISHAYARIIEYGCPVRVGGMDVLPGDLLMGDRHGVINVPPKVVDQIPRIAAELHERDRNIKEFCSSKEFSVERLREKLRQTG